MSLQLVTTDQLAFNYDAVAAPVAIRAREAAERIRLRLRRSAEDIIEIGRDLIAVKESLGHGQFLPWIEAEFGMHMRTAQRFMGVAETFKGKYDSVSHLDPSALYELAAPKTPIEVREEVERMIEAGEVVTKATIEQLRRERDGLAKAKSLLESEADEKGRRAAELQSTLDERVADEAAAIAKRIEAAHAAEMKRLQSEIADLRKRPRPGPVAAPPTIENSTGEVVPLHRDLTQAQAEEIDGESDDYADVDWKANANASAKAMVAVQYLRCIHDLQADPAAVIRYLTEGEDEAAIAEHKTMIDDAFNLIRTIKGQFNG